MNYFRDKELRARSAVEHTRQMDTLFAEATKCGIEKTIFIYDKEVKEFHKDDFETQPTKFILIEGFHQDHIEEICNEVGGIDTVVHNFASYKNPGGMYIEGSSAQEESLCSVSNLYNILREQNMYYAYNRKHLNRGLYTNRALYSPDVLFMGEGGDYNFFTRVLTCAAPNRSLIRYGRFTEEENDEALESRIEYIANALEYIGCKDFITGAFGCGVFRQDPYKVAYFFNKFLFEHPTLERVYFVIPKGKNYDIFKGVLGL